MSTLIKVAIAAGIVAVVVAALPDLKRYVEISRM
jgi:Tfp pilus assembly major pilin PilA